VDTRFGRGNIFRHLLHTWLQFLPFGSGFAILLGGRHLKETYPSFVLPMLLTGIATMVLVAVPAYLRIVDRFVGTPLPLPAPIDVMRKWQWLWIPIGLAMAGATFATFTCIVRPLLVAVLLAAGVDEEDAHIGVALTICTVGLPFVLVVSRGTDIAVALAMRQIEGARYD